MLRSSARVAAASAIEGKRMNRIRLLVAGAVTGGAALLASLFVFVGPVTARQSDPPSGTLADIFRFEYAVKFLCTTELAGTSETSPSVLPGAYETAVNIHNPSDRTVALRKKIAVAVPPGGQEPGVVSDFVTDTLDADETLSVACAQITHDFGFDFVHGAEGFLVIRSMRRLDVTAVYTAGKAAGEVESLAVERIRGEPAGG
jgi:hypothetical protein